MNLIDKTIRFLVRKKAIDLGNVLDLNTTIGWRAIGGSSSYGYYQSNQYENGYSSITTLANGFLMVEPYTVDKAGNKVASNILDRIYTPNNQMSAVDFREALMVMTLVHDKVRIRVHHKTENINADTITGFTFMENYGETIVGGKRLYKLQNGESLTDDDVITLKSINPDDINGGFSPSRAARRWTTIDDYIADYQAGFFRNGAVPAGEMIVTARTTSEFNDIVDNLQAKHKGAGKNNNITYSHRPTDQNGAPLNSQVEWVPFSSQNKDMALKDLFDNANKKIDSVYGVPASMRGVNDTNTYASMRVDEVVLVKYALSPLTLKIWGKFTHELNRITGGIGVAITYDLEIPEIADEEKVKAEAKKTDADTVSGLVTAGFTLSSAVEYVETGDISKLEEKPPEPEQDNPEITDAEEQSETPDQPIDAFSKSKQVSVRDMPTLYDELVVDQAMVSDASLRGCIMLKTEKLDVLSLMSGHESELAQDVAMDRSPVPGETSPHVTLLYGLLNNGNTWKDSVDEVLSGWSVETVTIEDIGFFELPDSYAIIAHIKKTTELVEGHDRIGLLPNAETFSEYKPHMTLAYIRKDADLGKWIQNLGTAYNGKELATDGIDYGDLPESTKSFKSKQLSDIDREVYVREISRVVKAQMGRQVAKTIEQLDEVIKSKAIGDNTTDEDKQFTKDMLALFLPLMRIYGARTVNEAISLILTAELSTENIKPFEFTTAQRKAYQTYLGKVAQGYADQTAEEIRKILNRGILDGATRAEIEAQLKTTILGSENEYRVVRLARTEINLSEGKASVSAMENVQRDTGYKIYKKWNVSSVDPCEFCQKLANDRVLVDENFIDLNDEIHGIDGGVYHNDFKAADTANAHPNCNCYSTYEIERG